MTVIFDLDYTLLNTKRFKEGLAEALGISLADFKHYAEKLKTQKQNYNLKEHLKYLAKENDNQAKDNLVDLFSLLDQYLFLAARAVLAKFKTEKHKLILLTYGNPEWQEQKLNYLNTIRGYFDQMIFCDENKCEALEKLTQGKEQEKFLIINDNARETLEIKKRFGNACEIFLIRGPYSENVEHNEEIHELEEFLDA